MATAMSENCPKCKGHLMLEKDHYGLYEQCLQCGYVHDLQIDGRFGTQQAKADNEEEGVQSGHEIGPNIVSQTMHQLIVNSLIESAPGGDK